MNRIIILPCASLPYFQVVHCGNGIPWRMCLQIGRLARTGGTLIERQQFALLRQNIDMGYEQFSGKTLEQYFHAKTMETKIAALPKHDFGRYSISPMILSIGDM
ncbi:MAG: hypothetical protein NC115_06350 [Bacteroidales bacterium]|nr:hypothetical protein [Bacteroidales bacterium]